jgi:hypothetical protein
VTLIEQISPHHNQDRNLDLHTRAAEVHNAGADAENKKVFMLHEMNEMTEDCQEEMEGMQEGVVRISW